MTTAALDHLAVDLEDALDAAPASGLSRADVPRELLVRPTIGGLLRMALSDWIVIALAWTAMGLTPTSTWPLWILVVASRIHAFGVILHDAAHQPLRGKTWRTRLLELLTGYPLATTLNAMRYHHLRHHRDSGMPSDPYFKAGVEERPLLYAANVLRGLLLLPFWSVRVWFGLAATLVPGLRPTYARVFLQDRTGRDLSTSQEVATCAREELGQALFQLALLPLVLAFPRAVLFGYVIPGTIAGLLAAWRLLLEHRYVRTADRRVDTIVATTCDHHLHWSVRWLFAPRNIGYHIVHHLHPQVALQHLPSLRDWYRAHHPAYPEPRR